MNGIYDLPPDSDYGLDFNYAQWTPNTRVTMLNVPWDNSYEDVVHFGSRTRLNEYIENSTSPKLSFENMNYAPTNKPIMIDTPFNKAYKFNYLRVYNPAQPALPNDEGKYFYYFITDVEMVAGNTTVIHVQLDVWQTFVYDVTFGNVFLERGHWGLTYDKDFQEHGRLYHTTPEGFDLGNELPVWARYRHQITSANTNALSDMDFSIMVTSTTELASSEIMAKNNVVYTSQGSDVQGLPNGACVYFFPRVSDFKKYMTAISKYPVISQGIVAIQAIPDITDSGIYGDVSFREMPLDIEGAQASIWYMGTSATMDRQRINIGTNWRNDVLAKLPARYKGLKKFLTAPYCQIEFTSSSGTPIVLNPENWDSNNIEFMQVIHLAQPDARIVFVPIGYNRWGVGESSNGHGLTYDGGEFFDMMTGINNLPTFSIVNNGFLNYMSQNKNSLAFQAQSIDWSQQRATMGAQLQYNQATNAMGNSQSAFNANMSAMQSNHTVDMVKGLIGGIGGMANGGGGMAGVAGNAVNMAMNLGEQAIRHGINVNQQNTLNDINQLGMRYNRDTNMDFAQKAIAGDNEISRAGLAAKIQDARTIQPSTVGQMGGDAFMLANNYWGVEARIKMVAGNAMYIIGEHWLRFGYAVNASLGGFPTALKVMSNFTYWKCSEVYIINANIPESFKRVIVGILKNGVTVWNDPDKIGRTDWADNAVVI